jgi:3-deoxy-D-manno-octulosonate 8-phosphate phosphatase (KDO 8-P phosphatase)
MQASDRPSGNLAAIRALALDVDGTLTDGGLWWSVTGDETKRFCFADVMGVSLARRAGLRIALISGEDSPLVDRYAAKLLLEDVVRGCRDKAAALRSFADRRGVPLELTCYMGDDVNDLPAMQIAGLSAAPADARPEVLAVASFISTRPGGNGAVRELVDALLAARGLSGPDCFLQR